MRQQTLDEQLKQEGFILNYDIRGEEVIAPQELELDSIAIGIDVHQKSLELNGHVEQFKKKVHRITNGSIGSFIGNAAARLYRKISKEEETSLMQDYNAIVAISSDLSASLSEFLLIYKKGFDNIEALHRKKSIELMDYINFKEIGEEKKKSYERLRQGLETMLHSKKNGQLTKEQLTYSDALKNVELAVGNVDAALSISANKIDRSVSEKERLFEERQYHSEVLNAYVEAHALSGDITEFFYATVPLHISSTYLVRNAKGLITSVDKLAELSSTLSQKTHEGLWYINKFNKQNAFPKNNRAKPRNHSSQNFSTSNYVKGLLPE